MTVDTHLTDKPRVSVLMTIYNAAPFLRESINSLIAQSFPNWELIAIENGSTDESPSILAEYTDSRIRLFSFAGNIGRTPALRHALSQSRGEYIAVLDADDASHPKRLARQVEFLDSHSDVVLVGSWAQRIDGTGRVIDTWEPPTKAEELYDRLGWFNPIAHSSAMYRRKVAMAVGGYPEQYSYGQDFALILLLAQQGRLAVIDDYLCKLRIVPGSMTRLSNYRLVAAREEFVLMRHAGKILSLSDEARNLNRRTVANCEIRYGLAIFRNGIFFTGFKMIICGLWRDPRLLWRNNLVRRIFTLRAASLSGGRQRAL